MSFSGKSQTYMETKVTNDGFYPDITLGDLQAQYRLPTWFETESVTAHVEIAISQLNNRLWDQQVIWIEHGYTQLNQVPCREVNEKRETAIWYKRAVSCQVMGLMIQQQAAASKQGSDEKDPDLIDRNEQYWFSEATYALKQLRTATDDFDSYVSDTRITAELL